MADFTFGTLTTAVVGVSTTVNFKVQTISTYKIDPTLGSISVQNLPGMNMNLNLTSARPGWLTGRRPGRGQLFPRGVYNK
jgi:hypothetical protein